jgi:hypothetical protein
MSKQSDLVSVSQGTIDADGATVLTVDRITSDGTIIDLQRDGSGVGSIGAATASGVTSVYAGNDDTALWFRNGIDAVTPFSISGNTTRDAAIDFGQAGGRFKDLYLSGGVYLGGTGSDNYLDDYEEGTYTAYMYDAVSGGNFVSLGTGYYTKVGRLVTFQFRDSNINTSGLTGGNSAYFSVPFAASSDFGGPCGHSLMRDVNWGGSQTALSSYLGAGESAFRIYVQGDNVGYSALSVSEFNSGAADIYFTGTYFAA